MRYMLSVRKLYCHGRHGLSSYTGSRHKSQKHLLLLLPSLSFPGSTAFALAAQRKPLQKEILITATSAVSTSLLFNLMQFFSTIVSALLLFISRPIGATTTDLAISVQCSNLHNGRLQCRNLYEIACCAAHPSTSPPVDICYSKSTLLTAMEGLHGGLHSTAPVASSALNLWQHAAVL